MNSINISRIISDGSKDEKNSFFLSFYQLGRFSRHARLKKIFMARELFVKLLNMNTKCPHCKKEISKVEIQKLPDMGKNDLEIPNDRYLVAACPVCETIISVVLNPERKGQNLEGK